MARTLEMLKNRENNDQTTFDSQILSEPNTSLRTNTMKLKQGLGQIMEKPEFFNRNSPLLADATTAGQQDQYFQLEQKMERMQGSIDELKSLILNLK